MKISRAIPLTTNTLAGVADALNDTKAKTIIIGSTDREGYFHELLPIIERVLRHLDDRIEPDCESLRGHLFLTPRLAKKFGPVYQRFAISVDRIRYKVAQDMLDALPREFFHSVDGNICLSGGLICISAIEAARRLLLIDDVDGAGDGYELEEPIEMYPYVVDEVQPPNFGRLACHLGARSTVKSVSFIGHD